MHNLVPIITVIFAFGTPAAVIIMIAKLRHEQKMEMIRRGVNFSISTPSYPGGKSLLWGLLLTALGVAALISSAIQTDKHLMQLGLFFLGGGVGMLVYWKLTASDRERERRLFEERYIAEMASSSKTTPQTTSPATESPAPDSDGQAM